ncbi:MAG TPA: BON domain-containing protein [Actinomycetota bacterium]|nr:BON domain-containing protein [Actinomycetota bacterium]
MAAKLKKTVDKGVKKATTAVGDGTGDAREKLGGAVKAAGEKLGEAREVAGRAATAARGRATELAGAAAASGSRVGHRVKRARKTIGYRIAGEEPKRRTGRVLLAGAAGALAAFFLDPVSGKRRRNVLKDRVAGTARTVAGKAQQRGRYVASTAAGKIEAIRHRQDQPPENDQTLAHKVESEVFQPADLPKGQVNVNAENGVIVLRGQVKTPDHVKEIERRARKVQGVRDVRNLLHLPGTEAETRTESPPAGPPTG